jgi:hypothetical protein
MVSKPAIKPRMTKIMVGIYFVTTLLVTGPCFTCVIGIFSLGDV